MRRAARVVGGALAVSILTILTVAAADAAQPAKAAAAPRFALTSPQIKAGGKIADAQAFNGFGCQGGNVSPELTWSNPPAGTQSFALMMYDPDAPTGSGWWHWVVYNIPASTTSLEADTGNPKNLLLPTGRCRDARISAPPATGARARRRASRIATTCACTP
jgi:phosphatidylethanolamine-binding protein (PEBP) family uncharacterized protein